jgi:outer membrane receptor protein involved in Fe transport
MKNRIKTLAFASCAVVALATAAHAQDKARFDIAGGDLKTALQTFAGQTSQEVLFSTNIVEGRRTKGVAADADPQTALLALLDGTGLTYRTTETGTLLIVKADTAPQSGSAAGGGAEVEALIVTAQKREEDIQDVPIAISAFSQEDLTRSQVAGGPDLITQVPNMTFTKTNFSSYSIQLRGIGTQAISATTDPAVAVAFNNTPFIRNRFFEQEFYDLQRVEVLRGPQGTLYGRNATAGVVNIISQKPKFVAEAKLSGDISNFNSSRLEGMANVPLVEDKVALRVAGAWTKREGYSTNELTGNPIDGRDLWSTRVSLRVAPTDRFDMNVIWEHFEENDDRLRSGKQLCKKHIVTGFMGEGTGPNGEGVNVTGLPYFFSAPDSGQGGGTYLQANFSQGCERNSLYDDDSFETPNGLMLPYYVPLGSVGLPTALTDPYVNSVQSRDLRAIESTLDPNYSAKSDLGELQVSFDLTDSLTLQSETGYARDTVYSLQDFNRFNTAPGAWDTEGQDLSPDGLVSRGILTPDGYFCDPQLGCSNRLVAVDISTAKAWQFSQELRLSSDYDGPFNFSLGANYLRADSEDKYYVFFNSISLAAARRVNEVQANAATAPYIPNVTDNSDCLVSGLAHGNPSGIFSVAGCSYLDPNPIGSVNDEGHNYFLSKNPYKLISYALFGEAYYQVADNLKITAGLRWTVDKKEAPRIPTWILAAGYYGYPVAEVIEQEWREPTGRLTVDWKPTLPFTDETMVYASYAHGYKAGGANPPGFVTTYYLDRIVAKDASAKSETRPRTFDPEFVDAFELGAKNTLADGRVTLNLAAFYYDYKDYQISEIVDRSAFNRNFDATVWGVEVEADWRPLENLRLGFKGGYEKTRVADGERAIDLMDRTAGDPGWTVVRPFPTYASSCIVPTWLIAHDGPNAIDVYGLGGVSGGNSSACEMAYLGGLDPVTVLDYTPNPTQAAPNGTLGHWAPGTYPGWDPATAPNGGEGVSKDLSGNELPNAPPLTATITADYTIPLPSEWLVNLHTDLHWQSASYWRIFNDHEYNKLDEYFTMNLAAIFTNEERGWNVMAYIKNVTDETAVTGAFLNSDDTGLTTNVFLTEPRLYGLRVTKTWAGGPLLGSFGSRRDGPYPLAVEVGGQIQRHDAPTGFYMPDFTDEFDSNLNVFDEAQDTDLDWGDGREVKLTWRPNSGPWMVAAGYRAGRANVSTNNRAQEQVEGCVFSDPDVCEAQKDDPLVGDYVLYSLTNNGLSKVRDREEHQLFDLEAGRDLSLADLAARVRLGVRHAHLKSTTSGMISGVPDWFVPVGFADVFFGPVVTHTVYDADFKANREFDGWGPIASFDVSYPILKIENAGQVQIDGSVSAGALFGDRSTTFDAVTRSRAYEETLLQYINLVPEPEPTRTSVTLPTQERSSDGTVPVFGASVGLSYEVDRFTIGAGYRWERYFDVLDAGVMEEQDVDRTIDGPYFKIAVGFGG